VFTVLLSEKQKQNEERKDKVLKKNAAKIDVCFSFISFPGPCLSVLSIVCELEENIVVEEK